MDFTIKSGDLARVIDRAASAVDPKSNMALLQSVRLIAGETLSVMGTDHFVAVSVRTEIETKEPGDWCLDAKRLRSIAKSVPSGSVRVRKKDGEHHAFITAGRSKFKVPVLPSDDYPPIPEPAEGSDAATLDGDVLLENVARAQHAISSDDSRPHLHGMFFEFVDENLNLVCTDGHRLAKSTLSYDGKLDSFVLPGRGVSELRKLSGEGPIKVSFGGRYIFLARGDETIAVLVEDGTQFPPYKKVIPKPKPNRRVTVACADLAAALKRVQVAHTKDVHGIRLQVAEGQIQLFAETPEGSAEDVVDAEADFEAMVGVSAPYLMDAIRGCPSERAEVTVNGDLDPITVCGVGEGYVAVVMPMRT